MASKTKEKYKSVFNVAVIGLSGTEQYKGSTGVGKSCLCNRFVRPRADDYYPEHTSVLSQSDFGGRVINNDHFLYWGEVNKEDDSGIPYKFNILEQTEFVDDQSYQPHRSSSNQIYVKRCAQTKVSSAEKMMYICTDQLGIESDFEQKTMPDGKLSIDGFLLCFDVSLVKSRTIDDQVKFLTNCLHYLNKTKKPVVLVLTKCDDLVSPYVKEAEKFATSGGKKGGLPIVETSAHENINVNLAFLLLAQMIDKARSKSKIVSFEDAAKAHKDVLNNATEELEKLLISVVKDYHETWMAARKTLDDKPAYNLYVQLLGKNSASKVFRKHVNRLCDEYKSAMQADYLQYLPRALNVLLPDINSLRSNWNETLFFMMKNPKFDDWIIDLQPSNGISWYESNHITSLEDRRIPKELLQSVDAENMFLKHKHGLEVKQRREEMKLQFKDMLQKSTQVTPGKEWGEVVKDFKSQDFLSELTEAEVSTIYNAFQAEITEKAKVDFQELLYEQAGVFVTENRSTQNDIHNALKSDPRYVAMAKLQKERDDILTHHITGLLYPNKDDWGPTCLEQLISRMKTNKPTHKHSLSNQWQLKPDSKTLNVVLLGADGLSRELANEITVQSSDDEYTLDGHIHNLRLRSIDGDPLLPLNSFKTSSFSPHGCIAVYSSQESLKYIQRSLEATVLPSADGSTAPFQGLPVSILLATSSSESNSHKPISKLRSEGELLASRLGCPFIDVIEQGYAYNRRFHETQIKRSMRSLIEGIKERAGSSRNSAAGPDEENDEPDLRIVMCTMREDYASSEVALSPLLRHSSYRLPRNDEESEKEAAGDEKDVANDTITVETYLGTNRRKMSITLTSYQSARHLLNSRGRRSVHGFILVYDTQRLGTFSVMKVFGKYTVSSYPLLFLCVSGQSQAPSTAFFSDPVCNKMIKDGNKLADELQAKFMIATANHSKQTEIYTTFFKEAWERKDQTEAINTINQVVEEINDFALNEDTESETNSAVQEDAHSRPITPEKPSSLNSLEKCASASELDHISSSEHSPTVVKTPISQNTPDSTSWILGNTEESETPNTSPTANLLDNEETPFYDYTKNENKPQHPGPVPGKLNQDLVSMVERVVVRNKNPQVKKPSTLKQQKSFTEGMGAMHHSKSSDTPYMSMFNPKTTGQLVLPLPHERKSESSVTDLSISSTASPHNRSKFWHSRPSLGTPKNKKNKDGELMPLNDTTPEPRSKNNRYSTAGLLDAHHEPFPTTGMKKGISHELLSVLGASSTSPSTNKEEKLYKQKIKEDKKRRKENEDDRKREKEKLKESKSKDKSASKYQAISHPGVHGNHHNASAYFNQPLDNIIQGLNHMIPLFVEKCVRFIEDFGIATEGLYRIPANAKEREIIIKKFDADNSIHLTELETRPTVQTIAGCLTWFFSHKNLPDPLIPFTLNDEMEEAMSMPDDTVRKLALRGVLRKLPPAHYVTFKYICTHLKNVSEHNEQNKMNAENLVICWWPTLFRPDVDLNSPANFGRSCFKEALLACIVQCQFFFYDKSLV